VFVLNNLAPGKYGVAILDVNGAHTAMTLTLVLQEIGSDWKLAGFYVRSSQAADTIRMVRAACRDFKAKSQTRRVAVLPRAIASPPRGLHEHACDRSTL